MSYDVKITRALPANSISGKVAAAAPRWLIVRTDPASVAAATGVFTDGATLIPATGVKGALLEREVLNASIFSDTTLLRGGDDVLTPALLNHFVSARFVQEYEVEGAELIQLTGAQAISNATPADTELTTLNGKLALRGDVFDRTISGNTAANPTVVTTTEPHGLTSGQTVVISGSDSTPTLNGSRVVTVLTSTTFSVPVNVSVAGTVGSVQVPHPELFGWLRAQLAPVDTDNFRILVEIA